VVCSSGVGFNPKVEDTLYTFDVAGLYNGLFVMSDRQTGSVWTHYDGSILIGPLANSGIRLEIQPIVHTTWAEWSKLHPDSVVLDWYPEFADQYRETSPGQGGLGRMFQETLLNADERLPQNEMVLGVNLGTEYRAYVLADFPPGWTVINDTISDFPVVVFIDSEADFGLAFLATVGDQELSFTADGQSILDHQGNSWNVSGRSISGPLEGTQLTFVTSFVSEWYGWAAYHPETTIYGE